MKKIIVVKGRLLKTIKKSNLDKIIWEIVRGMQPISSEEIWWEVGEMLDCVSMPTREEVHQRLEKMEHRKILERARLNSGKEKYTLIEK